MLAVLDSLSSQARYVDSSVSAVDCFPVFGAKQICPGIIGERMEPKPTLQKTHRCWVDRDVMVACLQVAFVDQEVLPVGVMRMGWRDLIDIPNLC